MGTKRQGRPKWPWILGGVVGSCLLLIGLLAFVTGVGPYDLPSRSRELDDVIAESKRLGLPMTAAELVGPTPSPEDNAATEVYRIIEQFSSPPKPTANDIVPTDSEIADAETEWVRNNGPALDEITVALVEKPAWYVERDWDMGPFIVFPEYAKLKEAAKMFAMRGMQSAKAKQSDDAIADFVASRLLAEKLATDRTLIALLVSIAIDSISLRTIETYVDAWRGDAARLRALEAAVAETTYSIDPRPALRTDFYFSLNICRNLDLFGGMRTLSGEAGDTFEPTPTPDPSAVQRTGLPRKMFERASMTTIAEAWNEVFTAFRDQGDSNVPWGDILDRRMNQMEGRYRASEILPQLLFPVFSQAQTAIELDYVNQTLAIAFVRAFRYRAENGKWPKDLEEIQSAFPDLLNPGKTIQAKFSETEVRVWSVGRDGVEGGGKLKAEDEDSDDTVFIWPPSLRNPPE